MAREYVITVSSQYTRWRIGQNAKKIFTVDAAKCWGAGRAGPLGGRVQYARTPSVLCRKMVFGGSPTAMNDYLPPVRAS